MKFKYSLVVQEILMLLVIVGLAGTVAFAGSADVKAPKGTIKKTSSSVTSGKAVKAQSVQKTAADKAQEQKITDTLRQMGFNVTGISRAANGQYNVRVNKFDAAKATNAFKGVLAFRGNVSGAARQVGTASMNRGRNVAGGGAEVDSIQTPTGGGGQAGGGDTDSVPTPGGGASGGPSIGDFDGGGGGTGGGLGPDGGGGIGPGDDGPGGGGIGPGDDGPGGGGIGPGDDGPGGGSTGPGNPTGPDGGGGNPPPGDGGGSGGDGGGGNPPEQEDGGGNPPEPDNGDDDDGGTPPTDPDDDDSGRVMSRDTASRNVARGNAQIAAGRTALTTGGTAVLSVMVSNTGVMSISRQSLANAGLNNLVPNAANGNVMFH